MKGVVGGQAKDITKKRKLTIQQLKEIYLEKTASLIEASVKIGGIVANLDQKKLHCFILLRQKFGACIPDYG